MALKDDYPFKLIQSVVRTDMAKEPEKALALIHIINPI